MTQNVPIPAGYTEQTPVTGCNDGCRASVLERRPLCLAITVDPEIPVPPLLYGGIERIVYMLVNGLVQHGHDVTLFANPESQVSCRLLPYPRLRSQNNIDTLINMWHVSQAVRRGDFDLIHSFARLAYLTTLLPLAIPKIMSYQRGISRRNVLVGNLMSRGTLTFTGCSAHLIRQWQCAGNFHVVYNGVPLTTYRWTSQVEPEAPLVYLGRVEEIKGVHLAIDVANKCGRRLIIAGNIPTGDHHKQYFEERIEPQVDGKHVEYVGPVDDATKSDLLGRSAALLMPLLWEEPFGIVMAEALACGTPIIGLRRGSLPEIVEHSVNGFVCDSTDEMVTAVGQLDSISRADCRRTLEERFSDRVIVQSYENLYYTILEAKGK